MLLKGKINADTGVKEFKNDKGQTMTFRQLAIVELHNPSLVKVSVPLDYVAKVGDSFEAEVFTDKVKIKS